MLTLVTATLDAARFLERAIASAVQQPGSIQQIVIDGGSRDETLAICARHPSVEVIVAPGCSIYEAWNLGVARARGDAVLFLNADDELAPDAASAIEQALCACPDAVIVAGKALVEDDEKRGTPLVALTAAPGGALDVAHLTTGVPAINAMAFRLSLFDRAGRFETRYRVAGDRAFLLRLALGAVPVLVAPIDAVLYRYHVHGGSLTLRRSLEQRLRVARDHLALSRQLLGEGQTTAAAEWLRHMRRREAVVASLRCIAAGRVLEACEFLPGIVS